MNVVEELLEAGLEELARPEDQQQQHDHRAHARQHHVPEPAAPSSATAGGSPCARRARRSSTPRADPWWTPPPFTHHCATGRLDAVLDVTDPGPLPPGPAPAAAERVDQPPKEQVTGRTPLPYNGNPARHHLPPPRPQACGIVRPTARTNSVLGVVSLFSRLDRR